MSLIVHNVRSEKDFKLLLTCPACLKSLYKKEDLKLLEEKDAKKEWPTKEIVLYEKLKKENSITVTCPNCGRFNITYVNRMEKKKAEKVKSCKKIVHRKLLSD